MILRFKIITCFLLLSPVAFVMSQVSTDGVKIISEADKGKLLEISGAVDKTKQLRLINQPDESAILDVYSTKQGILIPSFPNFESLKNISTPSIGLFCFVESTVGSNPSGIYVNVDGTKDGWKQMSEEDEVMTLPDGGVIMYYGKNTDFEENGLGKIGTPMEGWAICNGNYGTPDLRGMFVAMAVDQELEASVNKNSFTNNSFLQDLYFYNRKIPNKPKHILTFDQLPRHNHLPGAIDMANTHTHRVEEVNSHVHVLKTSNSGKKDKTGGYDQDLRRKGNKEKNRYENSGDYDPGKRTSQSVLPESGTSIGENEIDASLDIDPDILKSTPASQEPIDIRPSYAVLYYIMKVNYNRINSCYETYKNPGKF